VISLCRSIRVVVQKIPVTRIRLILSGDLRSSPSNMVMFSLNQTEHKSLHMAFSGLNGDFIRTRCPSTCMMCICDAGKMPNLQVECPISSIA